MTAISGADALIEFFENLSPEGISRIGEIYAEDAVFHDPFNEVQGLKAIRRIFQHMFMQVDRPAFRVLECVHNGRKAFLVWDFSFMLTGRPTATIRGASHIEFDNLGKVVCHRDYWDAAELYAMLPVVGSLMRWLRRRITTPQ